MAGYFIVVLWAWFAGLVLGRHIERRRQRAVDAATAKLFSRCYVCATAVPYWKPTLPLCKVCGGSF